MDGILQHFETTGNHCLLAFTRGMNQSVGLLRWCKTVFATIHSSSWRDHKPVHPKVLGLRSCWLNSVRFEGQAWVLEYGKQRFANCTIISKAGLNHHTPEWVSSSYSHSQEVVPAPFKLSNRKGIHPIISGQSPIFKGNLTVQVPGFTSYCDSWLPRVASAKNYKGVKIKQAASKEPPRGLKTFVRLHHMLLVPLQKLKEAREPLPGLLARSVLPFSKSLLK